MHNAKKRQLPSKPRRGVSHTVFPSHREVLLARLLLQVLDSLGEAVVYDAELYNDVKSFAEPLVREAPDGDETA